jgi:hypothetical protein
LTFETRSNSVNATIRRERISGISNQIPIIQVLIPIEKRSESLA